MMRTSAPGCCTRTSLAWHCPWPRLPAGIPVARQDKLDHRDLGHETQVVPEALDGFLLGVVEFADDHGVRLGTVWPLAFWRLDDDLHQELAGLDFRLVAVLKNLHSLHGWAGEPVPGELGDLLSQMIQLGSVHIRLPRVLAVISVTRVSADTPELRAGWPLDGLYRLQADPGSDRTAGGCAAVS